MRKTLTILAVAFATACCTTATPTESVCESTKIGFASQVDNRSIINDVEGLREAEIKLYGTYTLGGRTVRLFDAEHLYYDAELPGWDYATPQYWISGALYRFCAVCPYVAPSSFTNEEGMVTIGNYASTTGAPDLLYASTKRDLTGGDDFSTVPLNFRHACAAVQFNIVNASNATLTDVRNIRLVGLHNKGHFHFDAEGSAFWSLDESTVSPSAASQPFGGACTLPSGGLPVNLNVRHSLYDEGAILVLPQTIYKTAVTLHLEYIKASDAEYAIRNIELGWLGGQTPNEWKAGEKYEYTLTITDNTITTEVKVVDWIDHYVDL